MFLPNPPNNRWPTAAGSALACPDGGGPATGTSIWSTLLASRTGAAPEGMQRE